MRKNILLFFICSVFLLSCAFANDEVIKIVLPNEEIILKKPIDIENVEMFTDGGTIGVTIKDAEGKIFKFCRDGKLRESSLSDALAFASGTKKADPRNLFAYVEHPDIEGGIEIPNASEAELIILNMLKEWFSKNPSATEDKKQGISILIQQISESFNP